VLWCHSLVESHPCLLAVRALQAEAVDAAVEHRAIVEGLKAQIQGLTLVGCNMAL
jgi:hypothetical protein